MSAASEGPDQTDAGEALAELQTLSLVELDEESLRLHKLVLECSRAVLPEKARRESLEFALSWLCSRLPTSEYDKAGWDIWTRLSPHLDAIVEAAAEGGLQDENLGRLCNNYGLWLHRQARHISAEPMMRRALKIDEQSLGLDHPRSPQPSTTWHLYCSPELRPGSPEVAIRPVSGVRAPPLRDFL